MTITLKAGGMTAAPARVINRSLTTRRYITAEEEDRKQARVLTLPEVHRAFEAAGSTRFPSTDTMILAFSFWAGLRGCEITKVGVRDQFDVENKLRDVLTLTPKVAKYEKQRSIPMRRCFKPMLQEFLLANSRTEGSIIRDHRGEPMTYSTMRARLADIFSRAGLDGATSYSGRRTLITLLCRNMWRTGCTIHDVQRIAGHQSPNITMRYIQRSEHHAALLRKIHGAS